MFFRFDTIEILQLPSGTSFYKVLAIFSLSKKIIGERKLLLDTFLITAQLQKIRKHGQDDTLFKFLPYPVFKIRVPMQSGFQRKFFALTINTDEIYRPACFIEVPTKKLTNYTNKISDYMHIRYYGFDLRFCDRSMWNSTNEKVGSFASSDDTDIIDHNEGIKFILDHDTQLQTYEQLSKNQHINSTEDDDSNSLSNSSDIS